MPSVEVVGLTEEVDASEVVRSVTWSWETVVSSEVRSMGCSWVPVPVAMFDVDVV
jgi:hypothetical protein